MASPLNLRNRRREAQRAVRLAVNAVNAGLDEWKAAADEGMKQATALTNGVLAQLHLPALPLRLLDSVPHLPPAAAAKLVQQQEAALAALSACLQRLRGAVARLAGAAASLQQLVEEEEARPLLATAPVFASLPLPLLSDMAHEVHDMHAAELECKAAVLRGFSDMLGELRAAEARQGGKDARGGTGQKGAHREQQLRRTTQVYLTAWLLSAQVDEERAETHLTAIAADARGF